MNILFYIGFHTNVITENDDNIGGTETITKGLAKELAKRGHTVTFMAQNIVYSNENGVFYTGDDPDYNEKIDVLISVGSMRGINRFKNHNVGKIFIYWHNTEQNYWDREFVKEDSYTNPNYNHICVSEWHKRYLEENFALKNLNVVPNFINPSLFNEESVILSKKEGNKVIWSSDLERDFDKSLEKIKTYPPNYEMHVCVPSYGIDYAYDTYSELFLDSACDPNMLTIHFHESLPKEELYQLMEKCDYWVYDTNYLETFCITALEMQMNYVTPITSMKGGLGDSVKLNRTIDSDDTLEFKQYRRKFAESFTAERSVDTLLKIIDDVDFRYIHFIP